MAQRAPKMTGGPSGKKPGPGDLRHPAGAQHARLKRENTAKLPKGVTGVILGGKPGTHTVGGEKKVQITQKQMDALHAAKRSEEADLKRRGFTPGGPRSYKEPAWARSESGPKPHEVKREMVKKRTLRKGPPKKKTSPSDAEREAVGEGRAMWNKRGSKALREESIGTKLRSFGRSVRRKVTGRKASRNSGR